MGAVSAGQACNKVTPQQPVITTESPHPVKLSTNSRGVLSGMNMTIYLDKIKEMCGCFDPYF